MQISVKNIIYKTNGNKTIHVRKRKTEETQEQLTISDTPNQKATKSNKGRNKNATYNPTSHIKNITGSKNHMIKIPVGPGNGI